MPLARPKKKVPTTTHTTKAPVTTTSSTTPSKTTAAAVKAPVKKRPIVPPKEVKTDVPKKTEQPPVQREERKSPEAQKPVVASERQSAPAQPRPASKGAERVTVEQMRAMTLEERYKLFKSLNKNPEVFVGIRKELPKKMEMRKDEALLRNIIPEKAPKVPKGIDYVGYCPYCVDYQVFHPHAWTGYKKCIGCGITTKDFYVGIDNGIFGKE